MLVGVGLQTGALEIAYNRAAQAAAVFFSDSSTPKTLRDAYRDAERGKGKFKILIVPGHDDQFSGAQYGGVREADINLAAAKLLAEEFERDKNIEVRLVRTDAGYDQEIADYFLEEREEIFEYRASQMTQMAEHLDSGAVKSNVVVGHNFAQTEVAFRLWGINHWANEHDFDLLLHVHFNDVPRFDRSRPGWPTGFALYVPERQFSNAKGSMAVAEAIKESLSKSYRVSTLPGENQSPTEDQELIAIGSNNSLNASSVLIEYAYLYEPLVQNESLRSDTLERMARLTYEGVRDFLTNKR